MDAEIKAKWLAALRSGNYKQGSELLKSQHNEYCCLGVLAEVMGCEWTADGALVKGKAEIAESASKLLDSEFSGIGLEIQHDLAEMNDAGRSFPEIADYIEENL